jgi:hypothetical protein
VKLLTFGLVTAGYTIVAMFIYWGLSRCGAGGCPPHVPTEAIEFAASALSIYVLASLLFWGWRPFKKDRNVQ